MNLIVKKLRNPNIELDKRWFAGFVGLQTFAVMLAFIVPTATIYAVVAGLAAGILLVCLLIYPWLIVPAVIATTALDITGQLLKETLIGIPITGFHVTLGLMLIGIVTSSFLRRRTIFPEFELKGPLFMLLGVMAFSLIYTPNLEEGTIGVVRTMFLFFFLFGFLVLLDSRRAINLVVVSMAVALIGGCALGVIQIMTERFYLPASFVIAVGANAPRATGTFHNPNTFGTFLMCGFVFLFGIAVNYRMRSWKLAALLVAMGAAIAGLVTTFSRANWLAAILGVLIALGVARKLRYLVIVAISAVVCIFAVKEFVPFADHIYQRFVSIFTLLSDFGALGRESGSARIYFIFAGMEMFLDNPVLGAGWRAFPLLFDEYKPVDFPHWVPTKESHTLFANILAELGLVGFIAASWVVLRILRHGFGAVRQMQDPYLRAILIALLSVFVAFQLSLSATADFSNNFLWFFSGMIFAVIRVDRETKGTASES